MRLVKHAPQEGGPTTYTIENISMLELGHIQLGLIGLGQDDVKVGVDWVAKKLPEKPAAHGKHEAGKPNVS